jgi:hypothetical protein
MFVESASMADGPPSYRGHQQPEAGVFFSAMMNGQICMVSRISSTIYTKGSAQQAVIQHLAQVNAN